MKNKNFFFRFYKYQKERFPFVVLIFTTLSVVLSSVAVVAVSNAKLSDYNLEIFIGTVTCLLFMFNIRVFDDFKDNKFDNKYHKERPVQRGLITIKELNLVNFCFILIQILLNLIFAKETLIFWILAMVYSLIARKEFFVKKFIKKHFILYNFLNTLQIFFLQIYLYALIEPMSSIKEPLLIIHFVFVLANAVILEIARKLKSVKKESSGRDTYSGRYGVKKASLTYFFSIFFSFTLFLIIIFWKIFLAF